MEKEIIGHSTLPDPDGEKHEWLQYKYKDYIFNKEWYVDMENNYSMGLTIFKLGKKNKLVPSIKYKDKNYVEIFHSGHCNDLSDDEAIQMVELIINKCGEE